MCAHRLFVSLRSSRPSRGDRMRESAAGQQAREDVVHARGNVGGVIDAVHGARIEAKRSALYQRIRQFMEKYEFILLPVNQVLPFDVNAKYPTEIAGAKMENYIAWMKSAYYISIAGNPAMSVPCVFSESGMPIGIQIVGRHNDDLGVLQLGYAFEQATNIGERRPEIA